MQIRLFTMNFFRAAVSVGVLALSQAALAVDVIVETNLGKIKLSLDEQNAPESVANFKRYIQQNYYNGTIFHRVIPGFMIQGGGFDAKMARRKTNPPIVNESRNGLRNTRGSIAMARTSDPQSASSQFFINLADNQALDYPSQDGWGYAVFGKVTEGMDVVDKIAAQPTGRVEYYENVPTNHIIIKSVTLVK